MRSLCGMSYGEIGGAMGLSAEAAARRACARAFVRLKQILA